MSEQGAEAFEPPEDASALPEPTGPERTGVASVDSVLDDVEALDELPLEEHVATFERAHESLRSALDADPDARPEPGAAPATDDPA